MPLPKIKQDVFFHLCLRWGKVFPTLFCRTHHVPDVFGVDVDGVAFFQTEPWPDACQAAQKIHERPWRGYLPACTWGAAPKGLATHLERELAPAQALFLPCVGWRDVASPEKPLLATYLYSLIHCSNCGASSIPGAIQTWYWPVVLLWVKTSCICTWQCLNQASQHIGMVFKYRHPNRPIPRALHRQNNLMSHRGSVLTQKVLKRVLRHIPRFSAVLPTPVRGSTILQGAVQPHQRDHPEQYSPMRRISSPRAC